MKKVLAVLTVLVLGLTMMGCGGEDASKDEKQTEAPASNNKEETVETKTATVGELTVSYPSSWTQEKSNAGGIILQSEDSTASVNILPPTELITEVSSELAWEVHFGGVKSGIEKTGFTFSESGTSQIIKGAQQAELYSCEGEIEGKGLVKGYLFGATTEDEFYSAMVLMNSDGYTEYNDAVLDIINSISFS